MGTRSTIVTIPPFMVGFPKYDLATTVVYMSRQLIRLGYKTELIGPLDIQVRWGSARAPLVQESDQGPELPTLTNLHMLANKVRSSKPRK